MSHDATPSPDREYRFVGLHLRANTPVALSEPVVRQRIADDFAKLQACGLVAGADIMRRVGDLQVAASGSSMPPPDGFVLIELPQDASREDADKLAARGTEIILDHAPGVRLLRAETLFRAANSGTALPRPSPRYPTRPERITAAVECMAMPHEKLPEFREFMRNRFGPLGVRMVADGDAYRIIIMEVDRVLQENASLPFWNHLHILMCDFTDVPNTFVRPVERILQDMLGAPTSLDEAMAPVSGWRTKPFMTRNEVLIELKSTA